MELWTHQSIQQGERLEKQGDNIDKLTENIRSLANIAAAHEDRTDRLDESRH